MRILTNRIKNLQYKPQSKKSLQEEQPQQSPVYQEEVRPEISYERKYSGKIELRNVPMTKNSKEFISKNQSFTLETLRKW